MNLKRVLIAALLLALVAAVVAVPGIQIASGPVERLANGDFESGFYSTPVGFVGNGWGWFTNAGEVWRTFTTLTWLEIIHGQGRII